MSLYSPTILKFESIPNPIWCHSNTTKILLALISFATNILFQQISHVRRNLSTIALFIADIYYSRVRLVGYRICVRIMHEYSLSLCVGHHRQDVCVFIRNTNSDCFLVLFFFETKKKHCCTALSHGVEYDFYGLHKRQYKTGAVCLPRDFSTNELYCTFIRWSLTMPTCVLYQWPPEVTSDRKLNTCTEQAKNNRNNQKYPKRLCVRVIWCRQCDSETTNDDDYICCTMIMLPLMMMLMMIIIIITIITSNIVFLVHHTFRITFAQSKTIFK